MSNPPRSVLHHQQGAVLQLLSIHPSLGGHEIRAQLGFTTLEVQTVLSELVAQGLLQTDQLRSSVRYMKREFEHDAALVHPEWFAKLETWFGQGVRETVFSMARQMKLNLPETRATLEEMRKQGLLYGKFVGNMCVYSLRQRGVVRQG